MRYEARLLFCLAFVVLLGGCSTFQGYPDPPVTIDASKEKLEETLTFEKVNACTEAGCVQCQEENGENNVSKLNPVSCRNEIVHAYIILIDLNYEEFVRKFGAQNKGFEFGSEVGKVGLTTASALVTSYGASQVLTTILAGTTALTANFDHTYYYEKTIQAIAASMDAKRSTIYKEIMLNLENGVDKYPLWQALHDVYRYYVAGTLDGASRAIIEQAGKEINDADAEKIKKELEQQSKEDPVRMQRVFALLDELEIKKTDVLNALADAIDRQKLLEGSFFKQLLKDKQNEGDCKAYKNTLRVVIAESAKDSQKLKKWEDFLWSLKLMD